MGCIYYIGVTNIAQIFTTENSEILPAFAGRQAQRTTERNCMKDNDISGKIIGCPIINVLQLKSDLQCIEN